MPWTCALQNRVDLHENWSRQSRVSPDNEINTLSSKKRKRNREEGKSIKHIMPQLLCGHAEWVKTKDLTLGYLIHTLKLKLRPFEVITYVCRGSHTFAMFSAHALHEGRGHACISI